MSARDSLAKLEREVGACTLCPRLVAWRERVGREKRAAFRDFDYWSRPVPGFGDARAGLLILGLAPGAHGANRTGRPFTGDGAGPFLYQALHRAGFASAPRSESRDDGLELSGARITNAVRCVPPGNKPTPVEIDSCFPYLRRELRQVRQVRVVLCLGGIAWKAGLRLLKEEGVELPRPVPKFGHGAVFEPEQGPALVGSYHPSQLNTHTGRLTKAMFARVLRRCRGWME